MLIGIYGGSFDPIHSGHAMLANFIAQCNVVDEVWLVVSRKNPLKENAPVASDLHRLEMARLVAEKCPGVEVSDVEMSLPSPSFTIDTLRHLQSRHPEHRFKIIIGSDSLADFSKWKDSAQIIRDFGVIVYPRPGYPMPMEQPFNFTFLQGAPLNSMSSSLIREYISSGWNINFFVPVDVANYIKAHSLYL